MTKDVADKIEQTTETGGDSLNTEPVDAIGGSMAKKTKKDEKEYADRWVGDVTIGTTGSSLCIRPSEAKKAMGLMQGETVRLVIWRAPARNKLPKFPKNTDETEED